MTTRSAKSATRSAFTLSKGPSEHLYWAELDCHDGTPYPREWYEDRAVPLSILFEDIRHLLGDRPIVILSAFRTPEYNRRIEGSATNSQHVHGRALDMWHPDFTPAQMYARIKEAYRRRELPLLGGIGLYKTFVHIDTRPNTGRLATWYGKGVSPQ